MIRIKEIKGEEQILSFCTQEYPRIYIQSLQQRNDTA